MEETYYNSEAEKPSFQEKQSYEQPSQPAEQSHQQPAEQGHQQSAVPKVEEPEISVEPEKQEADPIEPRQNIMDSELQDMLTNQKATIKVVGSGGGGNNTINRITEVGIAGTETIAINYLGRAAMGATVPVPWRRSFKKQR